MLKIVIIIAAIVLVILGVRNYTLNKKLLKLTESIVEIRDKKPKKQDGQSYSLQLSNELSPYIKDEGEYISIKVVK